MERVDGVFVETFSIPESLELAPYNDCLLDVSAGIPVTISLLNFNLDSSHVWKVDEFAFYTVLLEAKRFAIKKLYAQLERISSVVEESKFITTQSRILMWKLEQLLVPDKILTDRMDRLISQGKLRDSESKETHVLKQIGYDDAPEPESYYAKHGPH